MKLQLTKLQQKVLEIIYTIGWGINCLGTVTMFAVIAFAPTRINIMWCVACILCMFICDNALFLIADAEIIDKEGESNDS